MTAKRKKTLITILISLLFLIAFGVYIYVRAMNEKIIPLYIGVLFALVPVILINFIWKKKSKKI